jgi:hypothetical protein
VVDPLVQVIVLVDDLAEARKTYEKEGLVVANGGRHPGRGTANLLIPFGEQYVELLAVIDPDEAAASAQGRPVLAALRERGPGLARWSIETSDIEAVSARLQLPIEHRRRVRPDGVVVSWRSVGVDESWSEPWRCAFMTWDSRQVHPARKEIDHPNGITGISGLDVVVADMAAAVDWIGDVPSAVSLETGTPVGPRAMVLGHMTISR